MSSDGRSGAGGRRKSRTTIDAGFLRVLHQIHARLSGRNVNWVVTGSLGWALQGVPVEVHDVDVQTDAAGAYEIERCFSEFVVERVVFSSAERIRSHFGVPMIDEIKVEIMGDVQKRREDGGWEDPVDLECYRRGVEIEGLEIPVLSLEYEWQAYLKLGRTEKAEHLRRWLDDS